MPLILLVLYVCLFSSLGALGLVGPDEPRYAAIARAMAETHDWVTPRLWGTPWLEKPVLYYWTAGTAMRIFGVSEFAARLPSALAALLAVMAVSWTALRVYGMGAAWYSLLMLPTSVAAVGFARAASPDMLFAGLLAASMAIAVGMLQKTRSGLVLHISFGFFLGAATLAKGPAAVILAGGATLLWAAFTRQWHASLRFLHPVIITVFCITALPWYVLCALRNPDFVRVFIWQHNFERYLTPVFEHRQPFWFFGPILLLALIPWLPVLALAIGDGLHTIREKNWAHSPGCFLACWTIFPLLFFSLSQSKLPGYVLPAIPPLFVLLGQAVSKALERDMKRPTWRLSWAMGATGLIFVVVPIFAFRGAWRDIAGMQSTTIAMLLSMAAGISVLILAGRKKNSAALCGIVLLFVALLEYSNWAILPTIDARISPRSIAREIFKQDPSGMDDVAVYELPRGWNYGLSYYFGREIQEWTPDTARPDWLVTGILGELEIRKRDTQSRWQEMPTASGSSITLLRSSEPRIPESPPH